MARRGGYHDHVEVNVFRHTADESKASLILCYKDYFSKKNLYFSHTISVGTKRLAEIMTNSHLAENIKIFPQSDIHKLREKMRCRDKHC